MSRDGDGLEALEGKKLLLLVLLVFVLGMTVASFIDDYVIQPICATWRWLGCGYL